MYEIRFQEEVEEDLHAVRPRYRREILQTIVDQLSHEPLVSTKNRKRLPGLVLRFQAVPPVWELRVGEYRVFYDVNEREKVVHVRAVRRKPLHKTTEEIQ